MTASDRRRRLAARLVTLLIVAGIWWSTPPAGLTTQAWRLFAIFAGAIVSVVVGALPLLTIDPRSSA